jgi:hypothetical protein
MYVSGMLSTPPDYITIYIAYNPQNLFHQINVLLQIDPTAAFSLDYFDFLFLPTYSAPGYSCYYVVRLGVDSAVFRFVRVNSLEICGPRSNVDFVHFIWDNFGYYCANYAITVLPMQTSADKILYARFYKAEIGGDDSRSCGKCEYDFLQILACIIILSVPHLVGAHAHSVVNSHFH